MCNSTNVYSLAKVDHDYPAIIIANVKPLARRSDKGYEPHPVRLRDTKSTIGIGSSKYVYDQHRVFYHRS
jgi:hypothetical protein